MTSARAPSKDYRQVACTAGNIQNAGTVACENVRQKSPHPPPPAFIDIQRQNVI